MLVKHKFIIFGVVENFDKYLPAMLKIWKKFLNTITSWFIIAPNCKLLLLLLPKVNNKFIIRHFGLEWANFHTSTNSIFNELKLVQVIGHGASIEVGSFFFLACLFTNKKIAHLPTPQFTKLLTYTPFIYLYLPSLLSSHPFLVKPLFLGKNNLFFN